MCLTGLQLLFLAQPFMGAGAESRLEEDRAPESCLWLTYCVTVGESLNLFCTKLPLLCFFFHLYLKRYNQFETNRVKACNVNEVGARRTKTAVPAVTAI